MAAESDRKTDIGKAELAAALRQAILDGSYDRVEKLVEYEGAVSIRFNYHFEAHGYEYEGVTPLILASAFDNDVVVKLLLDQARPAVLRLLDEAPKRRSPAIELGRKPQPAGLCESELSPFCVFRW
jgi:hypothetical protein